MTIAKATKEMSSQYIISKEYHTIKTPEKTNLYIREKNLQMKR